MFQQVLLVFGFAPTIVTFLVTRRTNTTVIALIANVLAIRILLGCTSGRRSSCGIVNEPLRHQLMSSVVIRRYVISGDCELSVINTLLHQDRDPNLGPISADLPLGCTPALAGGEGGLSI